MLICTARDFIKQDKINEYKSLIFKLIEETRKEEGNISYVLHEDIENKGHFLLIEKWKDQEALDFHFNSEHFKTLVEEISRLHTADSIVNSYYEIY